MRIYTFDRNVGHELKRSGSIGVTFTPVLRDVQEAYVACLYLDPHGVIGRHEAAANQLLLVVEGSGMVTGAEARPVAIGAGQAVFWRRGEMHETRAGEGGLKALVVEGTGVRPGCVMLLSP
jgi:quercetin dioxygenase-like cupin family protein